MRPYAELLEFNQPNPVRREGHTRIRDAFPGLASPSYPNVGGDTLQPIYNPERIVEFAGRWDYGEKNAKKLGENGIISRWIDMGHESMLEMADATFFIECSRVVSHELVRHRIASYQQESQRFVKYDDDSGIDVFHLPDDLPEKTWYDGYFDERWGQPVTNAADSMAIAYAESLRIYKKLREEGVAPQLARYVLPNAMRTRLIMKTNLREWRHIVRLRLDKSAQPEMQELMQQIYDQLLDIFPNVMYNAVTGERGIR
jgi:thymidylate synthase (FAD)